MKKLIFLALLFCNSFSFAQKTKLDPKYIEIGWSLLSPIVLQKIDDQFTKEIIAKAIPKIIKEDIRGAALEISDATYKFKNIKVLNKAFIKEQEIIISNAVKAIKTKDYAKAVNEIASVVNLSDKYIKTGTLDKPDVSPSESIVNSKSTLLNSDEINGKFVIENSSSYYFFVPDGYVTEIVSSDTSVDKFKLNLSGGGGFEIGVFKQEIDDENLSIDFLEKNPTFREEWTNLISKFILKERFGEGTPSPSSFVNTPNFKACKLPYLASSEASMTTTYLTFHNANLYMIYFKSPQLEFVKNSKAFDDFISMFFFGEKLSFCQVKKTGIARVVNKSLNPYDLYKEGSFETTINGQSEFSLSVPLGSVNLVAVQKSGYMMYPTENKRKVTINSPCQNILVEIGFEDQ